MAFIKGIDRNQKIMFPEYIEDYIKEDNPIKIIDEYVDTLDFKQMGFTKSEEFKSIGDGSFCFSNVFLNSFYEQCYC